MIRFENASGPGAVFQLRAGDGQSSPWTYTVGSGNHLFDTWTFASGAAHDLSVYGPNGFFRGYKGTMGGANLAVTALPDREPAITRSVAVAASMLEGIRSNECTSVTRPPFTRRPTKRNWKIVPSSTGMLVSVTTTLAALASDTILRNGILLKRLL
jgi:hypothetical protein